MIDDTVAPLTEVKAANEQRPDQIARGPTFTVASSTEWELGRDGVTGLSPLGTNGADPSAGAITPSGPLALKTQ